MMVKESRYLTIPNALSVLRGMIAVAMMVFAITNIQDYLQQQLVFATFVAAFMFATDFLDGWIARRWESQKSAFGAMIDPVTDKMAVCAFVLYLFEAGVFEYSTNLCAVLIAMMATREIAVSVLRVWVGHDSVPVVRGGKWKTAFQMGALLLFGAAGSYEAGWFLSMIVLITACGLTMWTGWEYFKPFAARQSA